MNHFENAVVRPAGASTGPVRPFSSAKRNVKWGKHVSVARAYAHLYTHIHAVVFIIDGETRGISMNALNFSWTQHAAAPSTYNERCPPSCVTRCKCPFGSPIPIAISDLTVSITPTDAGSLPRYRRYSLYFSKRNRIIFFLT